MLFFWYPFKTVAFVSVYVLSVLKEKGGRGETIILIPYILRNVFENLLRLLLFQNRLAIMVI